MGNEPLALQLHMRIVQVAWRMTAQKNLIPIRICLVPENCSHFFIELIQCLIFFFYILPECLMVRWRIKFTDFARAISE